MSVGPISHAMTTTAQGIEGYRATKTLTEVLCYSTAVIFAPVTP